ncbi:transcriptional regulator LuxR family [Phocaeicola coprophilus CAG:333]|uniref:response regulator transcription factor n=1 Tax=Phocaeicola coprophilus TaxID=387090 RepID=UPI0003394AEE|nr:response regulator transcription factor [Phocaeicola coprophilus]CDC59406.1 transcriptional regulator LuxR family [Phocaeicola coprophilus CAG:333]
MKSQEIIHIAVAETSMIVRSGLVAVLKRLPDLNVQIVEITSKEGLQHCMEAHQPEILIVNPQFEGWFDLEAFKQQYARQDMKIVSLICTVVDANQLKGYDESINLFDDLDAVAHKISTLMNVNEEEDSDQNSLSQREKEIIGCVVRGMTNKEIAEQLFISVHTVITHRRNITRKLQIHSAAGLTIYAIVNKLVELSEVKMNL